MAASTLSLGSSSYALLEELDSGAGNQLTVSKSGNSTTIRASGNANNTIEGLGISTNGIVTSISQEWGNLRQKGSSTTAESNSNINAFGNFKDFQASLGSSQDTLSIFGSIQGSRIFLDKASESKTGFKEDGNDLLNVSGSITQGDSLADNLIYAGSGNDTIRIAGSIEDAFVFLGAGNDSFTAGSGTNVDVKGDGGNDYIQFKAASTDLRINSGANNDTVVLAGLETNNSELSGDRTAEVTSDGLIFSNQGLAAIDLGTGNDSLVLGSGSYTNASFDTGSDVDTISIASNSYFTNAYFQLGSDSSSNNASTFRDKFISGQRNTFFESTIQSENLGGDSLVFGSTTSIYDSGISLGGGNDSLVFGSNSIITDSYINTGFGADTIVFGANTTFTNLSINIGGDTSIDRIYFNATQADFSGVTITGANDGDYLYIGATAYTYHGNDFYSGSLSWKSTPLLG
jgi:hypothetical protein